MFDAFSGLPEGVQVAIVTGVLAIVGGIITALIQKERKKKAKTEPSPGSVTATQKNNINIGNGAGAVVGRDQKISGSNKGG